MEIHGSGPGRGSRIGKVPRYEEVFGVTSTSNSRSPLGWVAAYDGIVGAGRELKSSWLRLQIAAGLLKFLWVFLFVGGLSALTALWYSAAPHWGEAGAWWLISFVAAIPTLGGILALRKSL